MKFIFSVENIFLKMMISNSLEYEIGQVLIIHNLQ
jgi:hypothetical protein